MVIIVRYKRKNQKKKNKKMIFKLLNFYIESNKNIYYILIFFI